MDKKAYLVTKVWVYFGYNFPNIEDVIDYICKQNNEGEMFKKHLMGKWNSIYNIFGSHAVMNRFYAELSDTYRQALVDYAIKFYAPTAFHWTDEEKELLGIKK